MKDYMTVKEIADLCEKTEKTIRTWIGKVFPNKMEHGIETKLSIDEVEQLFNSAFGKKVSVLLMQSTGKNVYLDTGKNVYHDIKEYDYDFYMMKAMQALEKKVDNNNRMIKAHTKYLYNQKQLPLPIDEEKEELRKRLKYAEETISMIQDKISSKGTKYDLENMWWNR